MEFHVFKVGSRYWIFKRRKLGGVLTKPRVWISGILDNICIRIATVFGMF